MVSEVVVLSDVVTGVLVNAISATGRRIAAGLGAVAGKGQRKDLAIARWFDTYQLAGDAPVFADQPPGVVERLAGFLLGDDVQAALHELLAARLTDAPEADVERIRGVFEMTIGADLPELVNRAGELFGYYDEQVCDLVGRLEGSEPAMLAQIRTEALNARMIAILGLIERHSAALASPQARSSVTGFLARYRHHVVNHHGQIDLPDFERRRRVPIADLYVPPTLVQVIDSPTSEPARELGLWALAAEIDRSVLLGDPGGGKTTAANAIMHHFASSEKPQRTPFLITLREFTAADPQRSVAGHIAHKLETFYQCPAPPGLIARLLVTGACTVIFDGLDELLDTARRLEVTAIIERFCAEYPLAAVLVTSRVVGYDQARLDSRQFVRYRLSGFSGEQASDYARKWFAQEDPREADDANRSAAAFLEESASVPDLRANPLVLALMCILYRGQGSLPRYRAEVYGQCAAMLFRKWDARRRIHLELQAESLVEPALRHLAWWLFSHSDTHSAVTESELIDETATFLHHRGFESVTDARQAAVQLVEFCRGRMWVLSDVGTTATGEMLYSFTHRTFLEYFAAGHLAYESDTPERLARTLAPHVARHEWEVVGELAVQIKDYTSNQGACRIFTALLGDLRRRASRGRSGILQFLARCLRSVDPSPGMVRALTRQTLDHLIEGDAGYQARAWPLCWVLACCGVYRSLVSEEIDARVRQMTSSDNRSISLNGVRLAGLLPFAIQLTDGRYISPPHENFDFWWGRTTRLFEEHSVPVAAAAADDTGVRFAALWWRIITMDEALRMPGGPRDLFHDGSPGLLDGTWAAYLPNVIHRIYSGANTSKTRMSHLAADLEAFGRHLLSHPNLPWISPPVDNLEHYILDVDDYAPELSPLRIHLNENAYLGAAATLLIIVETMPAPSASIPQRWRTGPLGNLYPYIEQRWKFQPPAPLSNLPIPDPFGQIFRDWAESKTDLI